jgi:hypothetical protein
MPPFETGCKQQAASSKLHMRAAMFKPIKK